MAPKLNLEDRVSKLEDWKQDMEKVTRFRLEGFTKIQQKCHECHASRLSKTQPHTREPKERKTYRPAVWYGERVHTQAAKRPFAVGQVAGFRKRNQIIGLPVGGPANSPGLRPG